MTRYPAVRPDKTTYYAFAFISSDNPGEGEAELLYPLSLNYITDKAQRPVINRLTSTSSAAWDSVLPQKFRTLFREGGRLVVNSYQID